MENNLFNTIRDLNDIAIFQIIFILLTAILIYYMVQKLLPRVADKISGRWRLYILATIPITRFLVVITAISMILSYIIKPDMESIFAILGALSIALGFAFKDYASSMIAGMVAMFEMPYQPGDWISVEGTYGELKSIDLRSMKIVTLNDSVVTIPNLKLWDHLISNANDGKTQLLCVINFYINPEHSPQEVIKILRDTALTSPFLSVEQPVKIRVSEKPWGTTYKVKAYPVDPRDQSQFKTDITVRGKTMLSKKGIEFANMPTPEGPL